MDVMFIHGSGKSNDLWVPLIKCVISNLQLQLAGLMNIVGRNLQEIQLAMYHWYLFTKIDSIWCDPGHSGLCV